MAISSIPASSVASVLSRTQTASRITAPAPELIGPPKSDVIAPSGAPATQIPSPVRGIDQLLGGPGNNVKQPPVLIGPPQLIGNPAVEAISKQIVNFLKTGNSEAKVQLPGNLGTAIISGDSSQINIQADRRRAVTFINRIADQIVQALRSAGVSVGNVYASSLGAGPVKQPPIVPVPPASTGPVKPPPVRTGPPIRVDQEAVDQPVPIAKPKPISAEPTVPLDGATTQPVGNPVDTTISTKDAPGRIYEQFLTNRLDVVV